LVSRRLGSLRKCALLVFSFGVTAVAAMTLPSSAAAASCDAGVVDKTWEGDVSSSWFTAGNWGPSGAPTASSDVCIPAGTPNPPVIGTGAQANAASIESSQAIAVNAGTLRISGTGGQASVLHDDLDLAANTTLNNLSSLSIEGNLGWGPSSTITGAGTTTIAAAGTLTASGDDTFRYLTAQTLHIDGAATLSGHTAATYFDTYLQGGAEIEIGSGGSLDLQNDQFIYDLDFDPGNLIEVQAGGDLTRSAGTGTATIQAPVDNDSTSSVDVQTGTLKLGGGSGAETSTGQFSAATGATLEFGGGTHATSGASFAGDGTVLVSSGQLSTAGASTVAAQTTLELVGGTLDNTGTLTVNGNLDWGHISNISGAGTTVIAAAGTLTASGNDTYRYLTAQTLHIDGTATLSGHTAATYFDTYLQDGAEIEIGSGGSLDLRNDQIVYDLDFDPGNLVHVQAGGDLTRSAGTGTATIQAPVDNDSTSSVDVQTGTLKLASGSGSETSTGQFGAASGATLEFGGTHATSGASFAGAGTVLVSNGTVSTAGASTVAAPTTLELVSGTLANAGTLTVNGNLDWGHNSTIIGASGTTTIAAAGTLTASGDDTYRYLTAQTLHIDGAATLSGHTAASYFDTYLNGGAEIEIGSGGSLDLQNDQIVYDLDFDPGNLVHVQAGGDLTRSAGTGTADVRVPVDNDSTSSVDVQTGTLKLSGGSGAETSTGQFSAATGATLEFGGGTHATSGASFAGDGTVLVSAGQLSTAGASTVATPTTLELVSGTLANTGTATVNGTLEWGYGSTISGAGTTPIAAGGTVTNDGGDARYLDTQTFRINGTGTFAGDQDSPESGDDLWMANAATLEIGSGGSLDLQRAQDLVSFGGAMSDVQVLAGGTLSRSTGSGAARVLVDLDNDGTLTVDAGTLSVDETFGGGNFVNYNPTSDLLSGGAYVVRNGSTFQFTDADVNTNGAEITLDGPGSRFWDGSQDGLRNYNANNASGSLKLRNGRDFTRTGSFTNSGVVDLDDETTFTATNSYTQNPSGTFATDIAGTVAGASYGQLSTGAAANVDGTLNVDVSAYTPQQGDVFDVVVAGTARNGTFATVQGDGFDVNYLPDRVRLTPPSLTIANKTVTEGNSGSVDARFRVDLSSPSDGTVTVDYATADGTGASGAKAPGDYSSTTGTLSFAPGDTTEFVEVPVQGDLLDEVNERYSVTLSDPQLAEIEDGAATGTITDDDSPPAVSINDVARPEGTAHNFSVTLSAPSGRQVRVNYATANGTATAPGDYGSKSGTLVFAPGQTTRAVTVTSAEDALDEADETFTVGLSSPQNATVGDGSGTGTINDDDPTPSLTITDSSRPEGGAAPSFTVTLSAASGQQVRVDYATEDGSAGAPGDYTAKSGTLIYQPGQTTKTVTVSNVQDAIDEIDEVFRVRLSNPVKATIADTSGLGTIVDDDPMPTISINDVTRSEGANPMRFTISLSAASQKQVTVDYATADGSAAAPGDYASKSGTLTFQPGQTSKDVTVNSVEDAIDEPNETYTLDLSNPTNGGFGDNSGTGTINDDD
jgi:hypothetical protein